MSCRGCIYAGTVDGGHIHTCDYILLTGHSRGCPIEGCTVKQTKGTTQRRKHRPVVLPGSLQPTRTTGRNETQGVRLSFNEDKALELYRAGESDREISEAVGVTRPCIQKWRVRRGLPLNKKGA